MKKLTAYLIAVLMLAMCFACIPAVADGEEQAQDILADSNAVFYYDFRNVSDFAAEFGVTEKNQVSFQAGDGFVTFVSEGDDPYFKFGNDSQPQGKPSELCVLVIKYRTTAKVKKGEIFTNHGGMVWGNPGTFIDFPYKNDGEWHTVIADATNVWGNSADSSLFAFRFDPIASGCKSGDTADIEFIAFFKTVEAAQKFVDPSTPDKPEETTVVTGPRHKVEFAVDGKVIYTTSFAEGEISIKEPVVPSIPGKIGAWEEYTLGTQDIKVNAVYTDIPVEDTVPEMPEDTTVIVSETTVDDITTEDDGDGETTAAVDTTVQTAEKQGCGSVISLLAVMITLIGSAVLVSRRD